ncbi:TetR/AcrR family transcriptional regulator [Vibrio furnissii]|uniref:TetR/AcrR family transcriptional regulator n=1 Tax=Vibrio furnissii TaxID=29494 RepID=UPI0001B92625|nr:TetR/AcrR family transcriptional regulator [Vibrio furnissii]ADT89355.1 hypothetical transcriptional regulator, TetR family [Vibrio furnissii NCTC 11218]EEX40074.1 transcriptional regulator [Vibrio furnissii CIP 102972]QDC94785.1 TetR/AcrR family transcriptional regulator [Vibrio furnissii]UON50222.1 TetR/AcrR family transcriptional regulator [Vibrio furnissii]SUQ32465.1 transcriptional regulator, TetR family [Vibrio furnissii]
MNAKTHDTRQHILEVGYQLVVNRGFTCVGLSELLKSADVPKGSFYHYFKSKEQFGEALIEAYFAHYLDKLDALFNGNGGTHYQKLMRYWHFWTEQNSCNCSAGKCLVVKLAGEVADLSEPMRLALLKGTNAITARVAECIEQGIQTGELHVQNSQLTSELLYNLWIGASLLNKIRQDDVSLQQALLATEQLLKGNPLNG